MVASVTAWWCCWRRSDTTENVIKKQKAELAEAEPKEAESPNSGAKMEEPRPKRTITKPPYLQDFVE